MAFNKKLDLVKFQPKQVSGFHSMVSLEFIYFAAAVAPWRKESFEEEEFVKKNW